MPVITPDRRIIERNTADDICGASQTEWISEAGGLSQFGAFIETLEPGSRSALKHWHSGEDEMVYVLEGEVTLIEGDSETLLRPGDAATFRADDPVGHCLANRSASLTRCLVVGTRAPLDRITYPDHDRVCIRDREKPHDVWTDGAGKPARNPYSG